MKIKRLIATFLVLVMGVLCFASCEDAPVDNNTVEAVTMDENGNLVLVYSDGTTQTVSSVKTIVDATVNEEKHLIITYSDGTIEDRGYQGPNTCTVIFVDDKGNVISTVETYEGLRVNAPIAPEKEDHVFAGWDQKLDKIPGNITVRALYTPKPNYTVTFKDHDGTILKTENVISGRDATPPADPTRVDYNFAGWEGDYTAVTENVEITATYTPKGFYTVTFVDYNGLVLDTVSVKEGGTASTSVIPEREAYSFRGWSGSLSNITANKTVTAQYTLNATDALIFDVAYKVSGNTVTLTLSLAGNVRVTGFKGVFAFEGMTATAATANSGDATVFLRDDGSVAVAYASATDVTSAEKVLTVTLTKTADTGKANLTIDECYDQGFVDVDYEVVGETLKLG